MERDQSTYRSANLRRLTRVVETASSSSGLAPEDKPEAWGFEADGEDIICQGRRLPALPFVDITYPAAQATLNVFRWTYFYPASEHFIVHLPWAQFIYYAAAPSVPRLLSSEAVAEIASLRAQLRAAQEALDLQLVRQHEAEHAQR